ncbi:MAG: hypothetical protein JJ969_12390 [Rhizobiaceae bacterium]|nr:hypothetical protein [Rhizobiaceae bacterium]
MKALLVGILILFFLPIVGIEAAEFETDLACVYQNTEGRFVFDGVCVGASVSLGQCRDTDAVRARYVVAFTAQSNVAVELFCDWTARVNGIDAVYEVKTYGNGREAFTVSTVEGERFGLERTDSPGRRGVFMGYRCTQDCSGHRAGYDWAAKNGIVDRDQCGGNSKSFVEGCWAYLDANR